MAKKLNLVNINTTAWSEENFLLMTSLTETQIKEIIIPIVEKQRQLENEIFNNVQGTINDNTFKEWGLVDKYDNDSLVKALKDAYPKEVIEMYTPDSIDVISI
jgi:hypothetical protein